MGRSKETFNKKEVRNKQLKKRKEKQKRKQEKKEQGKNSVDEMFAWVGENGQILSSPPEVSKKTEAKVEDIPVSVPKGGFVRDTQMYTGKISNFDQNKGYGFIFCSHIEGLIFVHASDCNTPLKSDDKVDFETIRSPKGLKATNVTLKTEMRESESV